MRNLSPERKGRKLGRNRHLSLERRKRKAILERREQARSSFQLPTALRELSKLDVMELIV
jgi:hypothetical protein